jgi:hypothetical protein
LVTPSTSIEGREIGTEAIINKLQLLDFLESKSELKPDTPIGSSILNILTRRFKALLEKQRSK